MLTDGLQVLASAQRRQRLARWRNQPGRVALQATLSVAIASVIAAACGYALLIAPKPGEITIGQAAAVWFAVMLLTVAMVSRARRTLIDAHLSSWLASAPLSQASIARHHRGIVGRRMLWVVAVLLLALTTWLWRAGLGGTFIAVTCLIILLALLIGATLGWWLDWWRTGRLRSATGSSRTARVAMAVSGVGFTALARWPTARLRERCSGKHLAPLVAPILVLMPMGVAGGVALAIIAFWVVLLIAVEMWVALREVIPRAHALLTTTPLSGAKFCWLMVQRALLVWLWIGVLLVGASAVIGMPLHGALVGAGLVLIVGAAGATLLLAPHLRRSLCEARS